MSVASSNPAHPPSELVPARFSVQEFDRMLEANVLTSSDARRIDLHRGEVLYSMPPGAPHDDVIQMLTARAFRADSHPRFEVRVQLSMEYPKQNSVVSPDLVLVRPQAYSARRPTAEDAFLVVEVSDSSLAYDLNQTMRLYAEAGVREDWVIDIPHRSLIAHRDPADGRYRSVQTMDEQQEVRSRLLSSVSLKPTELFR